MIHPRSHGLPSSPRFPFHAYVLNLRLPQTVGRRPLLLTDREVRVTPFPPLSSRIDELARFLIETGAIPATSPSFAETMATSVLKMAGADAVDYEEYEEALRRLQAQPVPDPEIPVGRGDSGVSETASLVVMDMESVQWENADAEARALQEDGGPATPVALAGTDPFPPHPAGKASLFVSSDEEGSGSAGVDSDSEIPVGYDDP